MGRDFSLFFTAAVLALCALESAGASTKYAWKSNYQMVNEDLMPGAYIPGTVYYRYDTSNEKQMRVHYYHNVYNHGKVSVVIEELENYNSTRAFKICGKTCESNKLLKPAEPWWYDSNLGDNYVGVSEKSFKKYERTKYQTIPQSIRYLWLSTTALPPPVDGQASTTMYLSRLEFRNGNVVNFNTGYTTSVSFEASQFQDNQGVTCYQTSCNVYMDVVFVFDESGSVGSSNWEKMKNFARSIVGNITVSKEAAAVGMITFSGNTDAGSYGCTVKGCNWTSFYDQAMRTTIYRCNCDVKEFPESFHNTDYRVIFKLTWESVKGLIGSAEWKRGQTCQGHGLEAANNMLLHNNTRVQTYKMKQPPAVVIALTDGVDQCPNLTTNAAGWIRGNLSGALVIEVGIGLWYQYDKSLLERTSTYINGAPSYFDANGFDALMGLVRDIVVPACENAYTGESTCLPACHGYCGCNMECFCPSCSGVSTWCQNATCTLHSNTTEGCKNVTNTCTSSDKCKVGVCNNQNKVCMYSDKDCSTAYTMKYCQSSVCSPSTGKCQAPTSNDNKCTKGAGECKVGKCDPGNTAADSDGCVYENGCTGPSDSTKTYNGVKGCMQYVCDNGNCNQIDLCNEEKSNKCFTYKCNTNTHKCYVSNEKKCESAGNCLFRTCNNATGLCSQETEKTEAYCKNVYQKVNPTHDYSCSSFVCNKDATGTVASVYEYCEETVNDITTCGYCDDDNAAHLTPTKSTCAAKTIEENNKAGNFDPVTGNHTYCYYYVCNTTKVGDTIENKCVKNQELCEVKPCHISTCSSTGHCVLTPYMPDLVLGSCEDPYCDESVGKMKKKDRVCDQPKDKCFRSVCNKTSDRCEEEPIPESVGDLCVNKVCDPETGEVNTSYKCEMNMCYGWSCDPTDGSCTSVLLEPDVACNNSNPCIEAVCHRDKGVCSFSPRVPDDFHPDPCLVYECDPETFTMLVVGPKCNEGTLCTESQCNYNGTCNYPPRECGEVNIPEDLEDCFTRGCSVKRKSGCYLKVIKNAYFDECGNCLGAYNEENDPTKKASEECKKNLLPVVTEIAAGVVAAIVVACVIAALGVSIGSTLLTRELIRRARAAADTGAVDNPMYQDNGREMSNPAFEGENMDD